MKFIDVILSLLKTLLSGWIGRLKENNPAGYRAFGIAFVLIAGFSGVLLQSGAWPGIETVLTYVAYTATGLAALFGINELADAAQAQVLAKSGNKAQAVAFKWRTVLYLLLVGGIFIGVMYLFNKGQKEAAPAEIFLSAAPYLETPETFSAPAEISNPETPEGKPIQVWFVQVLYYRLDTLSSVPVGGLPSFRVITRRDVTIDFPRVLSAGIPPETIFQNVRVPGYPHRDRVINAIILDR